MKNRLIIRSFVCVEALFIVLVSLATIATGADIYGSNGSNILITDDGGWAQSAITISGAPAGAVVTAIDVHFSCVHTYSGDLDIDLNDQEFAHNYNVWANEGGSADNPSRTVTGISTFNGLPVNGQWCLFAQDTSAGDTGYIDEWWIKIYYTSGGNTFAVYGIINNFVEGADADGDGYYETYDFRIGIDGDASPGTAMVYGKMICDTTGEIWWSTDPWAITGTATDYKYYNFDETDFSEDVTGNTSLDFTVEIWDSTKALRLAQDTAVSGEPIKADYFVAQTHVFNPNPVNRLNNMALTDQSDSDAAIPQSAYDNVSLTHLDMSIGGLYRLSGDFVVMENIESPANTPPAASTAVFYYNRSSDAFEEVMCYYHITRNQEYIQSLGFSDINNRRHRIDAHGYNGANNSHYVGSPVGSGYMAFGDGGVDDAEDADIILHEYGHSIQDNSASGKYFGTNDKGYGDETGAMGEGFGDYWACSSTYSESIAHGYNSAYVGEWDNSASGIGYLRRVNTSKIYPADMAGEVHDDGEIWSACLWGIFNAIGKSPADKIILKSHFLVPDSPSFEDGANAILAADADLYSGSHLSQIRAVFAARGIVAGNFAPTDIFLSSSIVPENEPYGRLVGAFSTTDPDAGNTFTYMLVSGVGSSDNGSFMINGSNLLTAAVFDYEAKTSYSVRVRSTDQGGLWVEKVFMIAVSNLNDFYKLTVTSAYGGSVLAGTNSYHLNTAISVMVTNSLFQNGTTQFVCRGWAGTGSAPASGTTTNTGLFAMTNDSTLVWLWTTNYWLGVDKTGGGNVSTSGGWLAAGTNIQVAATADTYYHFTGWSGDVVTNSSPLALVMNGACWMTANFAPNVTPNTATPEWWLAQYGLTNFNTDALADIDLDGLKTWQEYIAGCNPTDKTSCFHVTKNDWNVIGWDAVSGRVYSVYWATNLLSGFQCLESNIPWTRESFTNANTAPCGYYKIDVRLEE
jgi:subtilisin-like proprotein convertase family protein